MIFRREIPMDPNALAISEEDRQFLPVPRRRSAAAAAAAQQWEELESEATQLKAQLNSAHSQLQVFEESNKILHEDLAQLKRENERLMRENISIHTRIQAAAELLCKLVVGEAPKLAQPSEGPAPHSFQSQEPSQ